MLRATQKFDLSNLNGNIQPEEQLRLSMASNYFPLEEIPKVNREVLGLLSVKQAIRATMSFVSSCCAACSKIST